VVAKLLVDRNGRIARELGALVAGAAIVPEVFRVHLLVAQVVERTQQHPGPGMKGHPPVMFVWLAMNDTTARTSGSEVGKGPAPICSNSCRQFAGKVSIEIKSLLVLLHA
jgi:hypothetical protein